MASVGEEPVCYLRESVGFHTSWKLGSWMWMYLDLGANKQPESNLQHFQLLLLPFLRTAYLEPGGIRICQLEAARSQLPDVLTSFKIQPLESPAKISHSSLLGSIPEFSKEELALLA